MVWQDVEIETEGQASEWALEDVDVNDRIGLQVSKAEFWNEPKVRLVGQSSLGVVIRPYGGFPASLHVPIQDVANRSLKGKTKLTFWLSSKQAVRPFELGFARPHRCVQVAICCLTTQRYLRGKVSYLAW